MTHTVPCAISCRSDKNEKTSLLEMRTAIREGLVLQNRCEVMTKPFFCCPLKMLWFFFFFFNMCNESEHSANKFPYPGVLEDAELLQSPAHSESPMKEFTTFSEADIKETVGQLAQSTERGAVFASVRRSTFTWTNAIYICCFCYCCCFLM